MEMKPFQERGCAFTAAHYLHRCKAAGQAGKGTALAKRFRPAMFLCMSHDERVIFVKKLPVTFKPIHEKFLHLMIGMLCLNQADAREYPLGVCIHDEDGVVACIEENGVCRLRADAFHFEKSMSEWFQFKGKHAGEISIEVLKKERDEGLKASRLDIEITGRPDQFRKPRLFNIV